jgi:ATP-dependent DNA helicase RecQ
MYDFAKNYNFSLVKIISSLKFLQREGYIELTDEINNPSKIHFRTNRDDLYKFQVANAQFDGFIKLILRSYTGVFSDYVSIDEHSLAQKAKVDIDTVFKFLNRLKSIGVIDYIPQRKNPFIYYSEERLDDKSLHISRENYDFRKLRYFEKLKAIVQYAASTNKCRSQILLSYFGDDDPERCGMCDVCTRRNELDLSKYEFDLILDELKAILQKQETELDQVVGQSKFKKDKVIRVIQWLLDNEKIAKNDHELLFWVKTRE